VSLYSELLYFVASFLFILGIRGLTSAETARRGVLYAEIGMACAVAGTLMNPEIQSFRWILITGAIGSGIGIAMAALIPMTKMPERIALSHAFGGLAAALVGVSEYSIYQAGKHLDHITHEVVTLSHGTMAALGFEVLFGGLTFTGSLIAFGKLQGFVPGRNITYPFQNQSNIAMFGAAVLLLVLLIAWPAMQPLFYLMFVVALILGVLFVIPIGGADMPVVISLLNSYAGLAASATGFALGNNVLIIAGALDGASGFILSVVMSRAMNRSFGNVLFGAFGSPAAGGPAAAGGSVTIREATVGDAAMLLSSGTKVIVCPGYGMAVSQAQHAVQKMAELLEKEGVEVKYAIHPVAGRMPGHMNVLLAEANVPYDALKELEEINDEFADADVALVVGANDVVNPAAKTNQNSPIYGMPVLNADLAKTCIVLKRSMNAGFAGIENDLFSMPNTVLVFGDAKDTIDKINEALS
jgi:NAD(P) transhydrogenase subunit beta